jgi:hypothetical protein
MAHCPFELLDDLEDVLAEVRGWPGVREPNPGIFYVRGQPFLHFHLLKGGRRRGDIKGRDGWVSLDLPRPVSAKHRQALRRRLSTHYRNRRGA